MIVCHLWKALLAELFSIVGVEWERERERERKREMFGWVENSLLLNGLHWNLTIIHPLFAQLTLLTKGKKNSRSGKRKFKMKFTGKERTVLEKIWLVNKAWVPQGVWVDELRRVGCCCCWWWWWWGRMSRADELNEKKKTKKKSNYWVLLEAFFFYFFIPFNIFVVSWGCRNA